MRRMYGDMESTSVYRQMRSSMSPEQEDLEFKNQERHQNSQNDTVRIRSEVVFLCLRYRQRAIVQ